MNYEAVTDELINLIETELENSSVVIPYQKGNSIRIKNYAIRKNAKGYQIYDTKANARVAVTNFKISAIAIAKSLAENKENTKAILSVDVLLLKHYNDALFYRNRIKKTEDFEVYESRMHRLDMAIARSKALKQDLDRFIF